MNRNQLKKAAFLFREIGNISDAYLQEALSYRKQRTNIRPWITAVACILAVALVGGGLLYSPLFNLLGKKLDKTENPEAQITATLDGFLTEQRAVLNCTATSFNEINYFGSTYLILQYEDDETMYRSRDLTVGEVTRIHQLMGRGEAVGASSPDILCRVWLVCEDGTVLSPYLKKTDGNVGHAVLFDYEAEILPSPDLISCISDILN